eukprot:4951712-Pleurochrysis_carterae.AAC.1
MRSTWQSVRAGVCAQGGSVAAQARIGRLRWSSRERRALSVTAPAVRAPALGRNACASGTRSGSLPAHHTTGGRRLIAEAARSL